MTKEIAVPATESLPLRGSPREPKLASSVGARPRRWRGRRPAPPRRIGARGRAAPPSPLLPPATRHPPQRERRPRIASAWPERETRTKDEMEARQGRGPRASPSSLSPRAPPRPPPAGRPAGAAPAKAAPLLLPILLRESSRSEPCGGRRTRRLRRARRRSPKVPKKRKRTTRTQGARRQHRRRSGRRRRSAATRAPRHSRRLEGLP